MYKVLLQTTNSKVVITRLDLFEMPLKHGDKLDMIIFRRILKLIFWEITITTILKIPYILTK